MMDVHLEGTAAVVVRRLRALGPVSESAASALSAAIRDQVRRVGPREDIIRESDPPETLRMFLSGWACRYKMLEDGRRQHISLLLPGDTCDLGIYLLTGMDHSVAAITPVTYAEVSRERIEELMADHPDLAEALRRETLVLMATQREWTVSLGQRTAYERVAHLLCECHARLRSVGLAEEGSCAFPLTQQDIADAMGLSAVHVNRTLQELRAAGLITLRGKTLTINDMARLQAAALFNPNYLHLGGELTPSVSGM